MRSVKLNKLLKGTFLLLTTAILLEFVTSCSSDNDDQINPATSYKVVFKAEASSGSNIDIKRDHFNSELFFVKITMSRGN